MRKPVSLRAEAVRYWLVERDLTQSALAQLVGVGPPVISRLLAGERNADVDIVNRIAAALAVPTSAISDAPPSRLVDADLYDNVCTGLVEARRECVALEGRLAVAERRLTSLRTRMTRAMDVLRDVGAPEVDE